MSFRTTVTECDSVRVWRPKIGRIVFLSVRHSTLSNIVDAPDWGKKTYNNVVSTIRRAFEFGYRDHPEQRNPAALLRSARIRRSDRPAIDPFSIAEAEVLIAAIHRDWGEAEGNYDEFRFFTGLRPSEEIALLASDFDPVGERLAITKARVAGCDRDITKTGESRSIELCPRALAILQRQLKLRDALRDAGRLNHECLFFDSYGAPFLDSCTSYRRWRSTLRRLPIRYRKPYSAPLFDQLAAHDREQPALGRSAAWPQPLHDVDRLCNVDSGLASSGHCCHPPRPA